MSANPRDAFIFRVPRIFILEGSDSAKLSGWRNYQVIEILGETRKQAVVMSRPMTAQSAREKYNAKFYARGTWEDETKPVQPDTMPVPRAEILKEIFHENPEVEKRQLAFA